MAIQRIAKAGFKTDYITLSNSKTLDPAAEDDLEITILGAIFTESARLIDNLSIRLD
jgi:pantoate--beta-alanine ligase